MSSPASEDSDETQAVLVIGRREAARTALADVFEGEGFQTHQTTSPEEADTFLDGTAVDLVLMDGQPTETAVLNFCRKVRRIGSAPILVIAEQPDLVDEIVVLETGADGLLARDADPRLLLARSRALLRRASRGVPGADFPVDWKVDRVRNVLRVPSGRELALTPLMLDLMQIFLSQPGVVLTAEAAALVLGRPKSDSENLRTAIARLRRRLAVAGEHTAIRTIHGRGYVFDKRDDISMAESGTE